MYFSKLLVPTLREVPAEAEVISHQLLLKAGFIRKSSAGIYTYLPFAWRVLNKISQIIREEMDQAGGQEILMPIIQPADIWWESGRWQVYGQELFRLKDRHERDFCLSPTHEELVTDLVRANVYSYRQLPLYLYQLQNKYRDERRPRFGLMRGREFIMKDLYSFDRDEDGLAESYQKMYQAYSRIFKRCGLDFRAVEADSGAIGGSTTHEFMVIAQSGEAEIVYCPDCGYAANVEIAPCQPEENIQEEIREKTKIATPQQTSVAEVVQFLQVPAEKLIKSLFYQIGEESIAVLVRGDRKINEVKLQKLLATSFLEMATAERITAVTGCCPGFVGPLGLQGVKIYADEEIKTMVNAVCGANEAGYHYLNVQPERDFHISVYADLRMIESGESCPLCSSTLEKARGIEVGQVFKLGTKYSEALGAKYNAADGREKLMVMGCYGIGVSRTMGAAVEQNNDRDGIIWPMTIAPYQVVVIPISITDDLLWQAAQDLYHRLKGKGIEVVLDDRDERAGVKFKDADLIGYPLRLTVGKRFRDEKIIELKLRREQMVKYIADGEIIGVVEDILAEELRDWVGK